MRESRFGFAHFFMATSPAVIVLAPQNVIFLQAMGKAGVSTMLSMVREIVFGVDFDK